MTELERIKEALNSGTVPAGANTKQFEKLLKNFGKITNPKFVNLYPLREFCHGDMLYRMYAMPLNGESIDNATLEAVKEEAYALPMGSIRYNCTSGRLIHTKFDKTTGEYRWKESDIDDVMTVSNHFNGLLVFSIGELNGGIDNLDCHYAVYGDGGEKWDGELVMPITNRAIGKASEINPDSFVENPDAPEGVVKAAQKYTQVMQYVMYAMIAAGVVWYLFFR